MSTPRQHTCHEHDRVFEWAPATGLGTWLLLDAHSATPSADYEAIRLLVNVQMRRLVRARHEGKAGVSRGARAGEVVTDPRPAREDAAAA